MTCREPLQIINHETGYRIHFELNSFTHDYGTGITDWSYQSVFTELDPTNLKQKNSWEEKRKEVYKVSLTSFIKSLYNNSLMHDGFVLADFSLNADPANPFRLSPLSQNDILSAVSADNSKTLDLSNRQLLLVCYGRPVTDADISNLERSQYPGGQYSTSYSSIPGSGSGIGASASYRPGEQLDNNGLHRNLLVGKTVRIFSDGSFDGLSMAPVNQTSSSPLMGLSMKLPLEYFPEESVLLADATAENTFDINDIAQYFDTQMDIFPQEKIHLHTDRNFYVPGERIFFRAYVADADTHQPSKQNRYVYVELINSNDSLVDRVMIRPADERIGNGLFHGYLFLSEIIPEGNYTLRAYTKYMENLGDDYFFKKNIRIGNIKDNYELKIMNYENEPSGGNRKNDLAGAGLAFAQNDFEVSFFPEGGNLIEGVMCKIAFKALNRNGTPATVTGEIVDETGKVITSIQTCHAGMGVFACLPERGKRYYLKCRNESGIEKQFRLPQSHPRAYALSVTRKDGIVSVVIHKSPYSLLFPAFSLHIAGERYSISHPGIAHMSPSLFRKQNYRQALFSLFCSTGR